MDEQSKNIIGAEDQSKKPVGGGGILYASFGQVDGTPRSDL